MVLVTPKSSGARGTVLFVESKWESERGVNGTPSTTVVFLLDGFGLGATGAGEAWVGYGFGSGNGSGYY